MNTNPQSINMKDIQKLFSTFMSVSNLAHAVDKNKTVIDPFTSCYAAGKLIGQLFNDIIVNNISFDINNYNSVLNNLYDFKRSDNDLITDFNTYETLIMRLLQYCIYAQGNRMRPEFFYDFIIKQVLKTPLKSLNCSSSSSSSSLLRNQYKSLLDQMMQFLVWTIETFIKLHYKRIILEKSKSFNYLEEYQALTREEIVSRAVEMITTLEEIFQQSAKSYAHYYNNLVKHTYALQENLFQLKKQLDTTVCIGQQAWYHEKILSERFPHADSPGFQKYSKNEESLKESMKLKVKGDEQVTMENNTALKFHNWNQQWQTQSNSAFIQFKTMLQESHLELELFSKIFKSQ